MRWHRGWNMDRKGRKRCTSTSPRRGDESYVFCRNSCRWVRSRACRMIFWSRNGGNSSRNNLTRLLQNYSRLRCSSLIRNYRWNNWYWIHWEWLKPMWRSRKWWWGANREVVSNCRFRLIRGRWTGGETRSCESV